ncbi:C2H2 type zinc finger domain-containing protein [Alternaria alternata]|uniref:C2H2 type zinc finger domain-containing protein n=1 Tax=Alternaria alternata TaxID=5599 RepID=A0A177DD90_ALTAL|nr:C2H2 type zinc finger domain-containing protein [Alternaria alternata]OAG17197.1 C2H2 type zinc finger domain-containing protein [Alternaria alternata]
MSVDMAVTPTNARPSKRQRTSDASIGALQCQVCHRTYERADHLNRHLDSLKCDNGRPCKRCQKKGLSCVTKFSDSSSFTQSTTSEQPPQVFATPADDQLNGVYLNEASDEAQALLDLYNTTSYAQHTIPAFFEQIMVPAPDFMGVDYMQAPPDLTAWMPETDWLGQVDIFGNDFTPTVSQMLEAPVSQVTALPAATPPANTDVSLEKIDSDSARRRHAVFKQSAWFWIPERNQHAFSEHENIALDERNVDLASSPHMPYASNVVIPDQLSSAARDRIFQLVSKTAQSQITIPSFPSAECVDKLIKVGIAKRTETDAWIHPYTFESETARPEYLTALVAAGCVCFGVLSVSRTGLALQEIVRVALNRLSENDNSVIRDLEYLQASMLWLDIGAFCGYRRKMEIAESSLQSLVTALRRAGRFDHIRYPAITPSAQDSDEELQTKWKRWVEQESYKRLVYHLFEHDIHMTMAKHRPPLITYAELTLILPASKTLWLAPSAETWRIRYLEMDIVASRPSLQTHLKDEAAILCLPVDIDAQVARSSYLHGIAAQIWEYAQQSALMHEDSDPSSQLWARSRQEKLYHYLQREDLLPGNSPAVTCLFHQFLQMYLHVNLDLITRFAGKCGESAANSAYTHLSPWSQTKEARIAICHAGQVVRAARHIPPYQIRGPDSFMLYHAIMVLWTYSMMMRDRAKKTGTTTPMRAQPSSFLSKVIYLDDAASENQTSIHSFILMNSGIPCLRIISTHQPVASESGVADRPEICNLKYPSQVMKVGVRLLDTTHPDVDRETGPPLVRALCGLMEELGGLR